MRVCVCILNTYTILYIYAGIRHYTYHDTEEMGMFIPTVDSVRHFLPGSLEPNAESRTSGDSAEE